MYIFKDLRACFFAATLHAWVGWRSAVLDKVKEVCVFKTPSWIPDSCKAQPYSGLAGKEKGTHIQLWNKPKAARDKACDTLHCDSDYNEIVIICMVCWLSFINSIALLVELLLDTVEFFLLVQNKVWCSFVTRLSLESY